MTMGVSVLGPVQVDGEARLGPRERTVLSALALRAGQALSPGEIADACWGDRRPATWPKQIQAAVARLRRVLPRGSIVTLGAGYRLDVAPDELDVSRFSALLERSRRLAREGEPERAVAGFVEALDLWRGQPFADLEGWEPAAGAALRLAELRRSAEDDLLAARLASGDDEGVAVDAEGGVREEPLRERRWALLALAQYRGGRQGDALATIRRARSVLVDQLGVDPGQELVSLETAILRQDASLDGVTAAPPSSGSCPYPGLVPFDTDDHENFFGRDREIADGLARLEATPVLVLSGPSGCGKSSLLRAGLVAELRRGGQRVEMVLGGVDALRAVREAILAAGPEGVVALDQAEELLTGEDAGPCGAGLSGHVAGGGRVLLAVRADALADLAMAAELTAAVERGLYLVRPLGGAALRTAIVEPARRAGLRIEPGLVDLVLHDVEDQPAALPLLSHALVETWQRREGATLTVEGYEQSGGLSGAVSRSAERLFESLPANDRALCRSLMLRLVLRPMDGSILARHVPVTALPSDHDTARVLGQLVQSRLVTSGDDGVGLAHESLARSWPRLQTWLDEDTEGLRVMRHLATTAEAWAAQGRADSELYRGARLDAVLEWRAVSEPDLTALEAEFVAASVAGRAAEKQREAARVQRDRTQNRRLRWLLAAAVLLLVVTVGAGAVARSNASRAEHERDAAAAARDEQRVESLTNASLALRGTNRAEAALLAAAAYQRWPKDPRTHSALLGTFTGAQGFVSDIPVGKSMNGVLLPGGDRAFVAVEGRTPEVLDLQTLAVVRSLPQLDVGHGPGDVIAVSADGRVGAHLTLGDGTDEAVEGCHTYAEKHGGFGALRAASTVAHNACVTLSTFDLTTGNRLMAPVMLPTQMGGMAISPDGRTVAVAEGHQTGEIVLLDVRGKVLAHVAGPRLTKAEPDWFVGAITFGPDGTLYAGSSSGVVRRFDGRTGRLLRSYRGSPWSSDVALDTGRDGLLVTIGEQHIEAIDVRTGARALVGVDRGQPTLTVRLVGRLAGREPDLLRQLPRQHHRAGPLERPGDGTRPADPARQRRDTAGQRRWAGPGRLRRHAGGLDRALADRRRRRHGHSPRAREDPDGRLRPDRRRAARRPSAAGRGLDPSDVPPVVGVADRSGWRLGQGVACPPGRCRRTPRPGRDPRGRAGGPVPPARRAHRCHEGPHLDPPRGEPPRHGCRWPPRARRVRAPGRSRRPGRGRGRRQAAPGARLHLRGDRDAGPVPRRHHVLPDRPRQGRRHRRVRRPHGQAHLEAADRLADLGHGRGCRRPRRRPAGAACTTPGR